MALVFLCASLGTAWATHIVADSPEGHTTLDEIIAGGNPDDGYQTLGVQDVNENYIVRDPKSAAQPGRENRRRSLAYFGQLTDFQLADEESPARVEFADPGASSAWRPQEAFHPFVVDASIRQVNRFVPRSPVPQSDGVGNPMDFALATGDQADNSQRNEMIWVRELLEGGTPLNFNSGVTDPTYYSFSNQAFASKPSCPAFLAFESTNDPAIAAAEAAGYTGVQDYDDYPAEGPPGPQPGYYDPDEPTGQWSDWPLYRGLMDRAQKHTFTPAGLAVPSYWSNGNHDILVQGNEDANQAFEDIATACFKAMGTTLQMPPTPPGSDSSPDPNLLLAPTSAGMLVPPDPDRRFVNRPQIKKILEGEDNAHGFAFIDPAEETASKGNASYYAWDPPQTPGFRFINIDTNSEGGQTAEGVGSGSSDGNIDDPHFQWLKGELETAQAAGKLIAIFGHHPVRSMDTEIADEQAAQCTVDDTHGDTPEHDVNPGCDLDPRVSEPIHLGEDPEPTQGNDPRESFVELLDQYPNVVTYVAGHTHDHKLIPRERTTGGTMWWEINTASTADWPQQHRLIDIMDNRDGSLSIFGTVLDFAAKGATPPSCGGASPDPRCDQPGESAAYDQSELASIGRTFAYNDPQAGDGTGEGTVADRNVEMVLPDPRPVFSADLSVNKTDLTDPATQGQPVTYSIDVHNSGPDAAPNVVVTDHLPANSNFVSASQGCVPSGTDVVCAMGTIPNGGDGTATITVTPNNAQPMVNRVIVSSAAGDPVSGNDSDEETTQVLNSGGGPAACQNKIFGTGGNDTLAGTSGPDAIYGRGGDDTLRGLDGNDCVYGGSGRDLVKGNDGVDQLVGNEAADIIIGGNGRDAVRAGSGNDKIRVRGDSRDTVNCGRGRDYVKLSRNDTARSNCEILVYP